MLPFSNIIHASNGLIFKYPCITVIKRRCGLATLCFEFCRATRSVVLLKSS